jgi:hypothetical protein
MDKGYKSLKYIPQEKSLDTCCEVSPYPGDRFPSVYVDSKQMPEINDWEVGLEYDLHIRVKMKSYSVSDNGDGRSNAELSIEGYARETEKSLS